MHHCTLLQEFTNLAGGGGGGGEGDFCARDTRGSIPYPIPLGSILAID